MCNTIFLLLISLLSHNVVSRGIDIGLCDPKEIACKCGDNEEITFQVKEEQCTFFYKWRPYCKSCKDRNDDQVCSPFKNCRECDPEVSDGCISCPPGKYGKWCTLECTCQNGGICNRQGECTCTKGFVGTNCELSTGVCPRPPLKLENGIWQIFGNNGEGLIQPGAVISYRCDPDFLLRGQATITCLHDGTWSALPPKCSRKNIQCSMVEPVLGGRVTVLLPGNNSSTFTRLNMQSVKTFLGPYKAGTQLSYTCQSNFYSLVGAANRICQEDGVWSGRPPICVPECGHSSAPRTPFLTHGKPSEIGQWPWQVALAMIDSTSGEWPLLCGGSLISEHWIITAAHCVHFDKSRTTIPKDMFRVYLGKHFRNDALDDEEVQIRQIEQISVHPDYNPVTLDSDIAIIRVTIVQFTSRIQPICLPNPRRDQNRLQKGSLGIVSGWGTKEDGTLSSELNFIQVPIVSTKDCREAYSRKNVTVTITQNMICAGLEEGQKDVCNGDSGGPLVFPMDSINKDKWVLEGIISWGSVNGCGKPEEYGAYTRVKNYVDWINGFIQ